MNYTTTVDKAKEWGISQLRVAIYCKEGRIEGAELLGRTWFIPKEAKEAAISKMRENIQKLAYNIHLDSGYCTGSNEVKKKKLKRL